MSSKYQRKRGTRGYELFVIACEGAVTENDYFEKLKRETRNPKLRIEIIERSETGRSSWLDVVSMLDAAISKKNYSKSDEFFVVVDSDPQNHKMKTKQAVAAECATKGYQLIVSDPCVELWFLLHHSNIVDLTDDQKEEINANNCKGVKKVLRQIVGSYSHTDVNAEHYMPLLDVAIANAKALDHHPDEPWPRATGSRIYRVVEQVLEE